MDDRILRYVNDARRGGMAAGSDQLALTVGAFAVADVGQAVTIEGAGPGGGDLYTTITARADATHVTLADPAAGGVNGADVYLVVLDLNDGQDLVVGEGLHLGDPGLERVVLAQWPLDGEQVASSRRTNATMRIPLIIPRQASFDAVSEIHERVLDQIDVDESVLEWRPAGDDRSTLLDAQRAQTLPTLFRGQTRAPDCDLFDGHLTIIQDRLPHPRGARAYV